MTARVCPVHGEYAPSGICRWCEKPSVADHEWAMHTWPPWYPTEESPTEELARINAGVVGEPPGALALRDVTGIARTLDGAWHDLVTRGYAVVELRFTASEPVIDAETHAAEESRLLAQHAALRWERVARRWNAKHGGGIAPCPTCGQMAPFGSWCWRSGEPSPYERLLASRQPEEPQP